MGSHSWKIPISVCNQKFKNTKKYDNKDGGRMRSKEVKWH